jgi:hypothetical protein
MTKWCLANGATSLLTAHTLDDQAETVLMRLARTSSLDSLAGIPRHGKWEETEVFRPLLGSLLFLGDRDTEMQLASLAPFAVKPLKETIALSEGTNCLL